jgi:hypothetical protein
MEKHSMRNISEIEVRSGATKQAGRIQSETDLEQFLSEPEAVESGEYDTARTEFVASATRSLTAHEVLFEHWAKWEETGADYEDCQSALVEAGYSDSWAGAVVRDFKERNGDSGTINRRKRSRNNAGGVAGLVAYALNEACDDLSKAKALLLAARREVEKLEKEQGAAAE